MKIIRILLALFLIVSSASVSLANTPPPPPQAAKSASANALADDDGIPPPGLPINDHIPYLLAGGFILGMTIIYRNKIKKASV